MQTEDTEEEFRTYLNNMFFNSMAIGFPAKVVKFDEINQLLDVQPLVKELYNDEEEDFYVNLPMIQNVPFLATMDFGDFVVTLPVKEGDKVWLTGSNISLDDLLEVDGKEPIDIRESRKFDLSDMVAISIFKTKQDKINNYDKDNFVIRTKNNDTYLKIKANGEFTMKGTKLFFGADNSSTALANSVKVNQRLANIESFLNSHIHIDPLSGVTGIASVPYVESVGSTASTKVFTND
jgi:hypothetical protein